MDQRKLSMALLAGGGLCVVVGATWLVAGGGGDGPTTETASVEDDSSTSTSSTSTTSTSTTTTTTTGPPPDETPQEFLAAFNEAFASDDADFLIERLNQAVFDMFGSDTCIAYLMGIVTTEAPEILLREVGDPEPWDYPFDDLAALIEDVTPVEVSRLVNGETVIQELHWKLVDGRFTWFTDCGDPL